MRNDPAWSGSRLKTMALLALMFLAFTVGVLSRAQQNSDAKLSQSQEAKARPGAAEMKRLGFYLGNWTYTETYPKSAIAPRGLRTPAYTPANWGRAATLWSILFIQKDRLANLKACSSSPGTCRKASIRPTYLAIRSPERLSRPARSKETSWYCAASFRVRRLSSSAM